MTSVERAVFDNKTKTLVGNFRRLYFGNEFCEELIPPLPLLKSRQALARESGKDFTFVTPFVTDNGLEKLDKLFRFLDKTSPCEVVFNDWGVFSLLECFPRLIPVMGRLLTRQRRDPRVLNLLRGKQKRAVKSGPGRKLVKISKDVPAGFSSYHASCAVNSPYLQDFLMSRGIHRVEIDRLIWGMEIKLRPQIKLSVYYPYGYVSTGRMCWKFSLKFGACARQCQKYCFRFRDPSLPVPFFGIGGTLFYKYDAPPLDKCHDLNAAGLRLVYQPRLPF